jgi:hypothetical protein
MLEGADAEKGGCQKGQMLEGADTGKGKCRKGQMPERVDARKRRCQKGWMPEGRMPERPVAGKTADVGKGGCRVLLLLSKPRQ